MLQYACARVNIFTFVGSIILIGKVIEIKIRFLGLADVLKALFPYNHPNVSKFPPYCFIRSPGSPVHCFSDIVLH